jgi:hypothetical protein
MINYDIRVYRKYYKSDRVCGKKDELIDSYSTKNKDENEFYSVIKNIKEKYRVTALSTPILFNEKSDWYFTYTDTPMYYIKFHGNVSCLKWLLNNMRNSGDIGTYYYVENNNNEEAFEDMKIKNNKRKTTLLEARRTRRQEFIESQIKFDAERMGGH